MHERDVVGAPEALERRRPEPAPPAAHDGVTGLLGLQRTAGNSAVARLVAERRSLSRFTDQPNDIEQEWRRVVKMFTDLNKLQGQNVDYNALRDRTIASQYFNEIEWPGMVMGIAQQLDVADHPSPDAFMNTMLKQIDTKFRPSLSNQDKKTRKKSVKQDKDVTRTRKDQLKLAFANNNLNFGTLTDQELAYMVQRINKGGSVRGNAGKWAGATGAGGNAGEVHVPVLCYWMFNVPNGAQRVQDDIDRANTIYNKQGIFVDPVMIRQLTRADIQKALGHRVEDTYFLDFRGVDGDAGNHNHGHHAKTPKYKDEDTKKIIQRYIPTNAIGALWAGDMVADAGRSPGKSNDEKQKWVVINCAPTVNPIIFAHELGHLAFASSHPAVGDQDTPGHNFSDPDDEGANPTEDELSLMMKHNVLTSGGQMDALWGLNSPDENDVYVSPGQKQRATNSDLTYTNP